MTPEHLANIHAKAMTLSASWGAATIKGFVDAPGSILIVKDQAFALGRVIADEAELLTIAVHPKAQNKGLGSACLAAFEADAAERGARRVFLEVAAPNAVAMHLYQKHGYTRHGLRKRYYKSSSGEELDAVLMSKSLSAA